MKLGLKGTCEQENHDLFILPANIGVDRADFPQAILVVYGYITHIHLYVTNSRHANFRILYLLQLCGVFVKVGSPKTIGLHTKNGLILNVLGVPPV